MSRVGKLPVPVPQNVTVSIDGAHVTVKGPKGELERTFHPDIRLAQDSDTIVVTRPSDRRDHRALHGLTRALLNNMVLGVSEGFVKTLEIQGTGYRAELEGKTLVMRVGFSHLVHVEPLQGVAFEVEGQLVRVSGIDKQVVGQQAAEIRKVRPPEPYKGKGIRYQGEYVRRKSGKGAIGE